MSSADDGRSSETELKFEIASAALAKLRSHPALAAPVGASHLRSVYFDTPDRDLRNAGVSLRVRESGGRFVQTVKTRVCAGLIERHEWEIAVAAERPDPGTLANTPAAEVLGEAGTRELEPVFSTTVERAVHLWDRGGSVVEVSVDQGEISTGTGCEPIRELELELKAGRPAALFILAEELSRAAPMRLSFDSKAERGYRLAGHDPAAARTDQDALTPDTTAADAFRLAARSCLVQAVGAAQRLGRGHDPEALHQVRVGLRRLRAVLSVFKPVVGDEGFERIRDETRWLAKELDLARDLQVFMGATLPERDGDLEAGDGAGAFAIRLAAAEQRAYRRAVAAIESQRFSDFLLEITAWVEVGQWSQAGGRRADLRAAPVRALAARALERLHHGLCKAGRRFPEPDAEGRHGLRIRAKKLRYAAELLADAFPEHPKRRRRFAASLKTLQDRLGALNDLAVAGPLAQSVAGPRGGAAAFAAGLLVGRRLSREPALARKAAEAWKRFAATPRFWTVDGREG